MKYPSDLTNDEWSFIKDYFPVGNKSIHSKRTLINAILYVLKTGCQWRMLPKDFPNFSTVYSFYSRCLKSGIWESIMDMLVKIDRIISGKHEEPSYGIIDSQSVKTTTAAEQRGIDGGKKIKGRKRHIIVDTRGNILHVKVHAANMHDTVAGCTVFAEALEKYPQLQGLSADAGYRKTMEYFSQNVLKKTIDISKRIATGWSILPKRWVVERTFSWLNNFRRLSKDYEVNITSAENNVMIAYCRVLLKRLFCL